MLSEGTNPRPDFMLGTSVTPAQDFLRRSRAWIALTLLTPIAVAAILTRPHLEFEGIAEFSFEFVAWLLFFAGACLRWWATLFIGGRKIDELVTEGPYSMCRNPLYVGTLLMTVSVAVFLQSLTLFAGIVIVGSLYLWMTVPIEEQKLQAIHGERFSAYCRRVPRIIPNPRLYTAPEVLQVRLIGVRAEFFRMLQWSAVPIVCYFVEHLRMLPWWPTPLSLP
jgi:protein-S-isoprenylcysteine O-methyltransferase Ste14